MKTDKETQKLLVTNLKKHLDWFNHVTNKYIEDIERSKSVEKVMGYKRDLLVNWASMLPSSDHLCYFCIPADAYCQDCLYDKFHEVCNAKGSTWEKIQKAKTDLMLLLEDYYKGEHYDNRRKTIYCPACNKKFRRKLSQDGNYGYCSACMMFLGKGEKFGN